MIDPFTTRPRSIPLLFGEVGAKLAMGSESDPVIIGGANGAKGVIQYHCWGGKKLEVYLEVGKLKMEKVRLEDIIINITLTENDAKAGDDWFVAGSIEGKIALGSDMNKEGSEHNQAVSLSGAYIFDTSVPFFDVAVKLEFGPFDSFYMALMMRITRGRCSRQGDYVKGIIRAGGDDWKIDGSIFGNRLCINPTDPDAVRYNLTLSVDEISFADGLLNITDSKVEAIARGPYRGEDDYDLTIFDWRIHVTANMTLNVDSDRFALRLNGYGEFFLEMDAINAAEKSNSTEAAQVSDAKPGVMELVKTRIEASIDVSYGEPGDSFAMNITAHGKFSWPCHSFMSLDGSLELAIGDGTFDLGKMTAGFTMYCHDPDAYAGKSVYAIEVFTDHTKSKDRKVVREFNDYEVFDQIEALEAAEEAEFAPPAPKEASCEHDAQGIVMDSFWGKANVRTVHSRFDAEIELAKALDHLESMKDIEGYQLCNARIKFLTEEFKQSMIEKMAIFGELNHTEYSALRHNPRKAWELVASLNEPVMFAGGQFEISNILLNLKAYDKAQGRAPAMQKQDLFPDMDLKYYDLYGDFTATAAVDVEQDSATISAKAMRTSSAALGAFSLEATATVVAGISFVDDEFSFLWNLTVKMEMFVNTSEFYLHMRGEYNKPCNRVGVDALGIIRVNVPGAIKIENAIITGTLYCEGHDPRVEAYLGVESLVLADILQIEQVHVNLRSVTPQGTGLGLESLDWKLNVSGTIRFDKMLEKMPSLSSKDTNIEVHAKISVTGGKLNLDLIVVHFEFDIKYQGSQPPNNPMLHVYGGADFKWPCDTGESISADLTIDLNVGTIDLPGVRTDFVYYCGERDFTKTVWELDVEMLEPFNVQDMFVLTSANIHVNAYRYPTGGWWYTISLDGATDPNQGVLQFYVDVFISTKKDPFNELSRGFSMDANVNLTYTSKAFHVHARARVSLSDSCDSMHLSGTLTMPSLTESSNGVAARLGGAADTLRARARIELPCATDWVDQRADPTDALSTQTTADSTMKVQQFIIEANVDTWKVGAFSVTDASININASVRTDGAYIVMVNVSGAVTFDTTEADSMGPSSLGGEGIKVNVEAALSLGQTTFCRDCGISLLTADIDVNIVVKQSSFELNGTFSYSYPCSSGEGGWMIIPHLAVLQ